MQNYEDKALATLSNKYHGDLVGMQVFTETLVHSILYLNKLDKIKKALFYGKADISLRPLAGQDIAKLPKLLMPENETKGEHLIHALIGIATESCEMLEALLGCVQGAMSGNGEVDLTNIKEESGDLFWYLALLVKKVAGSSFDEVQHININKLAARFPDKFKESSAINRDLDKERKVLENGGKDI